MPENQLTNPVFIRFHIQNGHKITHSIISHIFHLSTHYICDILWHFFIYIIKITDGKILYKE